MKCCICGTELVSTGEKSNCSQEHIIPNAIGGILKSSDIYCKTCNSNMGTDIDKAFCDIFASIVNNLDMHFDRKQNATPYEGVLYDAKGNLYNVKFKNNKVTKMFNKEHKFVEWESNKYKTLFYKFNMNNEAFKMGMSKIAFDFAIYNKIEPSKLNKIFDNDNKLLLPKPTIIPFLPMTMFDCFMEFQDAPELYHILRLFNYRNYLFAYIELFNTFQVYVLLSDVYTGDIFKEFCQSISKNYAERDKDKILSDLKVNSLKDACIILQQYNIKESELSNFGEKSWQDKIPQVVYEKIRHKSNVLKYSEVIQLKYENINIEKILSSMEINDRLQFIPEFQYYTLYQEDIINLHRYKIQTYPHGTPYPFAISKIINTNYESASIYGHYKFNMLMKHLYSMEDK